MCYLLLVDSFGLCSAINANERGGEECLCIFHFHNGAPSLLDWFVHFTFSMSGSFHVLLMLPPL